MNKKKKIFIVAALLIALAFLLYFYAFKNRREKQGELTLYGNVDIRQVDLGFRVFGRVEKLLFDEGDVVKAGQLMAILNKTPYEEQVAQARAKVASIEASLQNAEVKLQRRTDVDPNAISRENYDEALYNRDMLRADLREAKAALASSLTSYQDTEMLCPTDGSILTRIREPGSIVNVGDPVFTLSIDSPVWIRAYVSEPNLGKIYPGMPAEVRTDTSSQPVYRGHIGFISPVAEFTPKNVETTDLRTDLVYRLRIIVDNPDRTLRQGMPVTVQLKR